VGSARFAVRKPLRPARWPSVSALLLCGEGLGRQSKTHQPPAVVEALVSVGTPASGTARRLRCYPEGRPQNPGDRT
jgi:hypothetical protein